MSESEAEKWVQTMIAITPEDDAVLREIAPYTEISAEGDVPLDLSPDNVVRRRPLSYKYVMTVQQLEETTKDAQNQTYLQGVPVIDIAILKQDAAIQTMYMRGPCLPLKEQKDIMSKLLATASMNDEPMPTLKTPRHVQTFISIEPEVSLDLAVQSLSETIDDLEVPIGDERDDADSEASGMLGLIINRSLWIAEPFVRELQDETDILKDEETQTYLKFNVSYGCYGRVVMDNVTQTGLSCGPKQSNTALLSDYEETKGFVKDILNECFHKGILPLLVALDVIDEIVTQCAARIRYPMNDQATQTVASYKTYALRDEELMQKLRRSVIVDPFEASIVVVPLMNDLLCDVCEQVAEDAQLVVKDITLFTVCRAVFIGTKLAEIRKEAEPKSMDHVFEQRRKKLIDSMLKKETETVSMQTDIGGVKELIKMTELKQRLCTVCRRPSICGPCCHQSEQDMIDEETDSTTEVAWKPGRMLRTQDILLAYKPCYVIMTEPGQDLNAPDQLLHSPPEQQTCCQPTCSVHPLNAKADGSDESSNTIDVLLQPRKQSTHADSVTGWSNAIEVSLTKPWSVRGSKSSMSRATTDGHRKSTSRLSSSSPAKSHSSGLVLQTAQALQILKNTFCHQEHCAQVKPKAKPMRIERKAPKTVRPICVTRKDGTNGKNQLIIRENSAAGTNTSSMCDCFPESCPAFCRTKSSTLKQNSRSINVLQRSNTDKLQDEYFKLIPVQCLSDSDS